MGEGPYTNGSNGGYVCRHCGQTEREHDFHETTGKYVCAEPPFFEPIRIVFAESDARGAAMEREKMEAFRNWIKENSGQFYDGGKRILAKMDELSGSDKEAENG